MLEISSPACWGIASSCVEWDGQGMEAGEQVERQYGADQSLGWRVQEEGQRG